MFDDSIYFHVYIYDVATDALCAMVVAFVHKTFPQHDTIELN